MRIIPSDWKFTPPTQTEWNRPLTREMLASGGLRVTQDHTKIASIYFTSFGGGIQLLGLKSEVVPKINASGVEFMQGDAYADGGPLAPKEACLTDKTNSAGSTEKYPTLDCYPEAYRNNFVKFMNS